MIHSDKPKKGSKKITLRLIIRRPVAFTLKGAIQAWERLFEQERDKLKKVINISMWVVFLCLFTGWAESAEISFGPKLGTTGAGLEIKSRFNEKLGLRVNLSGLPEVNMGTIGDCAPCYEHRLSPFFLGAYLDYHPLGGGFNLSAGVGYNGSRVGLDADLNAGSWYQIGNNVYSAARVGELDGKARFNDIVPYVGLGYDRRLGRDSNWSLDLDLGVFYLGRARVDLDPANPAVIDRADLSEEEDDLEDCLSRRYGWYPVFSVGLRYVF